MSGAMSPTLAGAAGAHALHAEAGARGMSIGHVIAERARNVAAARRGAQAADTLAAQTWRAMNMRVRALLVAMEAQDYEGDPATVARQPWGSFSASDQCRIGAAARELQRETAKAAYLR